jgi:DDE domain
MNRIVFSDLQWMRVAPQQAFSRAPVRYPTVLRSTPIPSIAISTVIPVRIGRTPTEVPQAIRSPRGIVTVTGAGRRKPPPSPHYRHRFPAEIISHAVWLYRVFSLSLRDVELLLAERGVVVSYERVRRWCGKFGASFASSLRRRRPQPGDKWYLDEVFIRIQGELHYLWRAVDQDGVCSTSWSRPAEMRRQRSGSSNGCSGACNMCRV